MNTTYRLRAFGLTLSRHMSEDPVLEIGETYYTRDMLTSIGCPYFIASGRLTKIFKYLHIRSIDEIATQYDPFSLAGIVGIGDRSMDLINGLLEWHGYDVERWWGWDVQEHSVTFGTYKYKALNKASKRHHRAGV